jgi:hypothetical protein
LLKKINNKLALSEVVGYVLLISMSLALAGAVYAWLMYYVTPGQEVSCDEDVAVIIRDFNYSCASGSLNLTLENRGMFNVAGYTVRVNNRTGAKNGVYTINKTGQALKVGQIVFDYYSPINDQSTFPVSAISGDLTIVEVQPIMIKNNVVIACEQVSKQSLSC